MNAQLPLIALSNAVFAIPLAAAAILAEKRGRNPRLAHALWVVTLIRLLAPPLIPDPIPSE